MNYRLTAFAAAALGAGTLTAQTPGSAVEVTRDIRIKTSAPFEVRTDTMNFVHVEMGFEAADVKGVPFSADFVTETTQALADGNRIKNSNSTSYARDGEGRSRREVGLGPVAGAGDHKSVFIHDPVSSIDYILEPATKTARKINIGAMTKMTTRPDGDVVFNRRIAVPDAPAGGAHVMVFERSSGPVGGMVKDVTVHAPGAPGVEMEHTLKQHAEMLHGGGPASSNANVKTEQLGKRVIEGVEAEGTRTTVTIPAGQIGNERAMETVSERWYSNELKTVVLTVRKDPRMGETNYKIANLRRGEPSRNLFEVPADFSVKEERSVMPAMKTRMLEKK